MASNPFEATLKQSALRTIHREHAALTAMLRSLLLLLEQYRRRSALPDFAALRAMLFYLDEYPEQRHHRQESELLFPAIRARSPLAHELLDQLDEDHRRSERSVRDLEHALLGFEMLGESRRLVFEQAAKRYVDAYLAHITLEEQLLLPLAARVLTPEDWVRIDEAFGANQDPLTGHPPEAEFQAIFTRIVNLLPAPLGLGEAI